MERINNYRHKAKILRQIHSDKSKTYNFINNTQSIITVIVSSFITFIGFYGLDKLNKLITKVASTDNSVLEFLFNFLIFTLFINVILHLVFQFSKKQSNEDKAIVLLTSIINESTDLIESAKKGKNINDEIVDSMRHKYETITSIIPANTDKEYLRAKKKFSEKQNISTEFTKPNVEIFDESFLEKYTSKLIRKSSLYAFLKEMKTVNSELYLGGGAVRNLVWDELHNYSMYTQISDLDIVYFDTLNNSKEHEKRIENQLFFKVPNIKWSVKNQARMHIWNDEAEYISLDDAIEKWPETCTAIAIKLNDNDEIEYIKPFGLTDLYRLIVVPTPHFKHKLNRYKERVNTKAWLKTWPKLRIFDV